MFYVSGISSNFERNKYKRKVINQLELIKEDVDSLVEWDKRNIDEGNSIVIPTGEKDEYNQDYLELQRIVNKLLKAK